MKRSNRSFVQSSSLFISKYGQLIHKLEFTNTGAVKFWKFFPEGYFNINMNNFGKKRTMKSIYLFNWNN